MAGEPAEHVLEIREPGLPPRRVVLGPGVTEAGREGGGLVVADPGVSRSHLRFLVDRGALSVADLGSTNGTLVNGSLIGQDTVLHPGDTVEVGDTIIRVGAGTAVGADPAVGAGAGPEKVAALRPARDELDVLENDAVIVRSRAGTAGAAAAPGVAAAFGRARRLLAGFGSEPSGARPQVCLVDPYPDPEQPEALVTGGTTVDVDRQEIWMVVSAESPPEAPERPLALLFGAGLPAAADLGPVIEGYGLHLADAPDTDAELRDLDLPPLRTADGELASAMAVSFVRFLVRRGGAESVRQLTDHARPGAVEAAAQGAFGAGMLALEDEWRAALAAKEPTIRPRQFLRMTTRHLRPYAWRQAELVLWMVLGLSFTLVFPFAFRRLLDSAIPSGDLGRVFRILAVLGLAFFVTLVAGLRRAYVSAFLTSSIVRRIRTELFDRLQLLSARWFSFRQEGDVISRLFGDVQLIQVGLSQALSEGVFQVLSLLVACVILVVLDPLLAVVVIVFAPLVAIVYKGMGAGAQKRSLAVQAQMGEMVSMASENFGGQPVIKAFALEERERGRFHGAADRLVTSQVRLELWGGLFDISVMSLLIVLRLGVLGLGAWLILRGNLTIGGLVAFMAVMGEVLGPVTVLTDIGQRVQASSGALVRINEILEAVPEIADTAEATALPTLEHEITLDGVGFSYSAERRVLEGLNATIRAGSRVAFVGPTGAGKSSVLHLLMRSYDPDEGAVRFDGRDLRSATVESVRGQLGVVFQDTFLFDTTIRENIAIGKPGATTTEIEDAAKAAELHEFIVGLPRGYDTLVGARGGRVSGGQRQRLAIARALVRDPRVLLLDEATSALDPRTERLIATTLERVGEGRTTIAVTHRLTSITGYDRIFVIVAGAIVEQGRHEELVAAGGVYAGLWNEQTGAVRPVEAPFDTIGALRRVPLFSGLAPDELDLVAGRLRAVELAPGESVAEGRGDLLVLRRGRAQVLVGGLSGALAPVADLVPGDSFGLSALLGQQTGAVLHAVEPVELLVLDDAAIAGLAATLAPVAAALEGQQETASPTGGRRLSRVTGGAVFRFSVVPSTPSVGAVAGPPPDPRRLSGSYRPVGR